MEVAATVTAGDRLPIIREDNNFYLVTYNGEQLWISKLYGEVEANQD